MTDHKNIHEALLAVQESAPDLSRRGEAQYGSYVTLDDLIGAMRPLLNEHGVVLVQSPTATGTPSTVDPVPALRTTLTHAASGTEVTDVMPLVLQQETPQGQGSAITYARRYALQAALGLACETDDDGDVATSAAQRPAARRQATGRIVSTNGNGAPPI